MKQKQDDEDDETVKRRARNRGGKNERTAGPAGNLEGYRDYRAQVLLAAVSGRSAAILRPSLEMRKIRRAGHLAPSLGGRVLDLTLGNGHRILKK